MGTLTGLIGVDGVVGIFKSDDPNLAFAASRYVGGFVAEPDRVNLADWTASFESGGLNAAHDLLPTGTDITTLASGTTRFLQWNDAREFVQSGNNLAVNTDMLLLNNEANNGIGFNYTTSGGTRGFAGLLSATNVGAPLNDGSKDATWSGNMIGNANGKAFSTTLDLVVDYTNTSASEAGTVISAVTDFTAVDTKVSFKFDGTFNDAGVMKGTVAHFYDVDNANTSQNGVFNGLIGVDGAVGVFKNDTSVTPAADTPYVGGFVVKHPQ